MFLFFLWRRLKEDYPKEIIFGVASLVLIGLLVGYLASFKFFPNWFFWFEAFGAFLGFSIGILKYDTRFFETFEAIFLGFLPWLSLFYLKNFISRPTVLLGVIFVLNFALLLLFDFLDIRYKNFSWYKSGRIGLSGLLTAGVFFLIRAAIATFFPFVISFSGRKEIILSGLCAFTIFFLIYNLAKQET